MAAEHFQTPRVAQTLFHICEPDDWRAGQTAGRYDGTAIDRSDGFIHFSDAAQLPGTAERHFTGKVGLIVLEVLHEALAPHLKWEAAPDGTLFPHFYGTLALDWVVGVHKLDLGGDGRHVFPFLDKVID